MKQILNSLYGKVAVVFLLMLLILGIAQAFITVQTCIRFMDEAERKLNLPLAENVARDIQPYLAPEVDYEGVEQALHGMLVMHPDLRIYLVDTSGMVLSAFADSGKEQLLARIDPGPIRRFLADPGDRSLRGDDPRRPGRQKRFSAAPINYGANGAGFVYFVLGGEEFDSMLGMLLDNEAARTTMQILLLSLLGAAIFGLFALFLLNRRFKRVTHTVKEFEQGKLEGRIPLKSNDEVGQIARTFNHMADTIMENMEELKQHDHFRRELIANISHDLRTPLTSIQGFLEMILMKDDQLSEQERRRMLQTIFRNTTQLNQLITDLFELSKLDTLGAPPRKQPFSICQLAERVLERYQARAAEKKVRLTREWDNTIPPVHGDSALIEKAIANLVDNAISFTPPEGEVRLLLQRRENRVEICVKDSGCGIPEKDLPYVFERSYRVEKSRRRDCNQGAGLGLAITKKIIEAHQSSISVRSVVNQGTTFVFSLPVYNYN